MQIKRRKTHPVQAGKLTIGGSAPLSVQSMCATRTSDIEATLKQIRLLEKHGADLIRIAVDSRKDVAALKEIRRETDAALVVDLQESYRLARDIAPLVQKLRYNPGHLHHHKKETPVFEKVKYIVEAAGEHNCAIRIGVNFGSLDPGLKEKNSSALSAALNSALQHVEYMQKLNFKNFLVSLKSSDPLAVVEINRKFAESAPNVPLHLGVTEAGMLPQGEIKTRLAFEKLLAAGIGDTLRVSLTLPFSEKYREIEIGRKIIEDVYSGRFLSVPAETLKGLNIISCPSCSRVENEAFIELAEQVREMSRFAASEDITIAVMGCRVNGPGETDSADLGLWCAPSHVNLKRGSQLVGKFSYNEILTRVRQELNDLITAKRNGKIGIAPDKV
ncbi:MAG: 4-hydroxy-3-methylbut-2-en-1-yl diphosphate synthase [Candidatus Dadabacteria bacterium]|nr:MAG: 4-hydroxy-3-methylbut-2-en-1-yl diphosphate synthase [Candidatus Dadabacteria bacterium]